MNAQYVNLLKNLNDILSSFDVEGNCGEQELERMRQIYLNYAKKTDIKNVLEIGFNAGHSSIIFLSAKSNINVVSIDIGTHSYVSKAKDYIDSIFPNRHKLVIGESNKILSKNNSSLKKQIFDLILIDGGHQYDTSIRDINNCKNFAHSKTIVIMDDIIYDKLYVKPWTIGPTQAWQESIRDGNVDEVKHYFIKTGRGFSIGKYKF